jgi:hypothetical protein
MRAGFWCDDGQPAWGVSCALRPAVLSRLTGLSRAANALRDERPPAGQVSGPATGRLSIHINHLSELRKMAFAMQLRPVGQYRPDALRSWRLSRLSRTVAADLACAACWSGANGVVMARVAAPWRPGYQALRVSCNRQRGRILRAGMRQPAGCVLLAFSAGQEVRLMTGTVVFRGAPSQPESASRSAGSAVPAGSLVAAAQAMHASGRIRTASAGG